MENSAFVPRKKRSMKGLLVLLVFMIMVSLGAAAGYFYFQYQKLVKNPVTTQITAQEEANQLIAVVGKLFLLPKDELPTIATITENDVNKLASQLFFKNVANGDKVMFYPNSKLLIVYNPSSNLIINAGLVNQPEQKTATSAATAIKKQK